MIRFLADISNLYQFNYGNVMRMASWGEYKEGIELKGSVCCNLARL